MEFYALSIDIYDRLTDKNKTTERIVVSDRGQSGVEAEELKSREAVITLSMNKMGSIDDILFETMLKVENKDIFIDLKRNRSGVYLKISERNGTARNTVLIPASGILRLKKVLEDVALASVKTVVVSRERRNRIAGDPEITSRSLYVTGLSWYTEEDELIQHFSQAGKVVSAAILRQRRNGNTKISMGCGVVEYATREMALAAVSVMNETELKGRMIRCREDRVPDDDEIALETAHETQQGAVAIASPVKTDHSVRKNGGGIAEPKKVFVTSLTWDTTEDDLAGYFGTVGTVTSATILSSRKGRSMGSGIVEFADKESVNDAISRFSNVDFKGRVIAVREYFQ
jgi:RNA recognition motif-containing protein